MAKRKSPDGRSTSSLIQSAHIGNNAELFPSILRLHVPKGSVIADVTYGKGVFWNNVNLEENEYTLNATDIENGVDCRDLPYDDESLDALVFDPPYMEGFYRDKDDQKAGSKSHSQISEYYSSGNESGSVNGKKWQEAVHEMYFQGSIEALRVIKNKGIFIVKCQDAVSANKQHMTHVEIINFCRKIGFYAKDLFVLVRHGKASASTIRTQKHARKNHSYFLVFQKL